MIIVDLSHYNEKIDWDKLAKQCPFVILRATCGTAEDKRYHEFVSACWERAIPFHAYHYLKATTIEEAIEEANAFYVLTSSSHRPLFYVVDCEYDAISMLAEEVPGIARMIVNAFEAELRRLAGSDIRVACYIGGNNYKRWDLDYGRYAYIWIPRYGVDDGRPHTPPEYPCDLWQYTSNGTVDFVSDDVDLNKHMGVKPLEFFTGGDKKFTNLGLAKFCLDVFMKGWRYWYGTCGYNCSQDLYEGKKKQYPDHYGSSRTSGYMADIEDGAMCADCVGMIKAYFWLNGDINSTTNTYKSNNCPDRSANGLFSMCESTGPISTMPNIPGLVVHKNGHIGVHVGDYIVVEMRGYASDCVKDNVSANDWSEWGMLPSSMLSYVGGTLEEPTYKLGERILQKGDKGNDVTELQTALLMLGYDLGDYGPEQNGVDGEFGSMTEIAVRDLQSKYYLTVDGQYGKKTHKALLEALTFVEIPDEDTPDDGGAPVYMLIILGGKDELEGIQGEYGGELVSCEEAVMYPSQIDLHLNL